MRVRSYERLESGNESARAALELLHAEVLDTVSLERTVQFITLDVTDIVAVPETYQFFAAGEDRCADLRFGRTPV